MVGKAYRIPSATDRLRKHQIQIRNLQAINRIRNTPRPVATTAFAGVSAAGSEGGTGNFLRTVGDTMIGPLALAPPVDFTVDIDADGIIDIGESSSQSQYSSNIQIEDVPTSTTLDTIKGAAFDGQILIIRTFAPGSITIAQATLANGGNIQTPNDADFDMGNLQMISLVFDEALIVFDNAPGGTWRVLTGDATGGGGLSEPIILGINTLTPQTLPTTTPIAWNTKNPQQITLDRAVEFEFTDLPPNGSYEGILVIIDIDGIGGFDSPIWPVSLTNPPIISTDANTRTSVMLYTIDGGTTVTHATSVGSSTGGGALLSNITIDVTKDWLAQGITNFGNLTGVTGIDMDGTTATLQGVQLINLFQTDQQIESTSSGIMYMAGDLQEHLFKSQSDNIARFEESAAGVFRLDMLDHAIKDAKDITFDVNATLTTSGAVPAIGFDSGFARLLVNVPTGAKVFVTNNNVIDATQMDNGSITTNIINANDLLQIGISVTAPVVSGEFRNDGTDTFVFSGSAVRNFSNIPVVAAATTELDNLTTTSINAALLPNASATLDFGSELLPWRIGHFREIEFPVTVGAPGPTTDNQISVNTSNNMAFNVETNGAGFLFYFEGVNKWSFSPTQLSGDFILLQNSLVFNDSTTNPIGDGELTRNGSNMLLQTPEFTIQNVSLVGSDVAELTLLKIDTGSAANDAVAEINFSVFDSPTTTNYARIKAQIIDQSDAGIIFFGVRADGVDNITAMQIQGSPGTSARTFIEFNSSARIGSDLQFQVPTGSTDLKIFPALNALGIVVQDNVSFTVGSLGTNAIPISATLPTTAVQADGFFGDHKGAEGMFDNGSGTLTKFIRQADGNWGSEVGWTRDALT